ncbi:MAG TPA: GNAT family N-acetyltransferase [Candidatus Binatia bacterium]|nr:GNAT family N-acetyltransferase [Candidatus Binatia bacterium]
MASLDIRPAHARDVERLGDLAFIAFYAAALRHAQPPAVSTPAESRRYVEHLTALDPLGGLVAEEDGQPVGFVWVHVRGPIATIGPLAVEPRAQGRGVGRRLLERAIALAGPGVPQIRLVQESWNAAALGLYLRAGFRVVAPLVELELPPGAALAVPAAPPGLAVRPATTADAARVTARDARAFGAPRPQSVDLYLGRGRAVVGERGTALVGYALGLGLDASAHLGSAAADEPEVLLLLLAALARDLAVRRTPVRVLLPATDRRLVEGLVGLGFRVLRACQYLGRGGASSPPPNYVLMSGDLM